MVARMSELDDLLKKGWKGLKTLGGEIEERVKEAGEDAKKGWEKIKPKLEKAEEAANETSGEMGEEFSNAAKGLLEEVGKGLLELKKKL
jgi:hypothetical protein